MKFNKYLLILLSFVMLYSQSAFAARFGGGKSFGMQRNVSNYSTQNRSFQQQPQSMTSGQQGQGMRAGTAAMLGAAAGAAGGYMLGRNSNNNINASGTSNGEIAANEPNNSTPWGMIGILAILLCLGLMLFRKSKANPGFFGNSGNINNPNGFNNPTINRTNATPNTQNNGFKNQAAPIATNMMDRMPDGIEALYFLRQVKGMFLHIQSMNNQENVTEIQKYMTDSLYNEVRSTVFQNSFVADFTNLDCQLLNSEMVNNQLVASVKFFGMVSDEPEQPSHPFSEIWNFIKTDLTTTGKWLVTGIQQEELNK